MYKELYHADDLVNLSEEIVFEQIHLLIQSNEVEVPQSQVSLQDVAAIALNNMPAKYICNLLEKQHPSLNLQAEVKDLAKYAKRQVLKAIEKVSTTPHD